MTDYHRPTDTALGKPEKGVDGACEKLSSSGACLSKPDEAGILKQKGQGDKVPQGFSDGSKLLAGMNAHPAEAPSNGPEFPLKGLYNSEQPYLKPDGKPTARGEELQKEAGKLVAEAAKPDGSLSLKDHGKIMQSIADNKNLSEADRWYLYKQVCKLESEGRDDDGRLIPGTQKYRVLFDSEKPSGLPASGKGDVVHHIIIDPTNDSYHGGLVYGSSSMRAGYMRGEKGIFVHERIEKPLVNLLRGEGLINHGDEEASFRQLKALRAMQQGGFKAYSQSWNDGFGK